MPRMKSLAEELADLAHTAPTDLDLELDPLEEGATLLEDEAGPQEIPRSSNKGLKRNLEVSGKAYSSQPTSRRKALADAFDGGGLQDDVDDLPSIDDSEQEEDDGDEEEGSDGGRSHSDISQQDLLAIRQADAADEVHRGGTDMDEDGDQDDGGDEGGNMEADGELEEQLAELQAQEAAAAAGMRARAEREKARGLAVSHQRTIWDGLLSLRMLLQRCLQGANRLPRPSGHAAAVRCSDEARVGLREVGSAAAATLTTFLDLQQALAAQHPGASISQGRALESQAEMGTAPGCDELWARLDSSFRDFAEFRDASLDRWHRKADLASGQSLLRSGGLKALNQPISAQVANLMLHPEKAVQRSQLPADRTPPVMCQPSSQSTNPALAAAYGAAEANGDAHQGPAELDPESYDDADFYQELLKDLLAGSASALGPSMANVKGSKKRKHVDRRASKGRKLRYTVQPKLVNFMTPVDHQLPIYASQLFSNLFGSQAAG